FLYLSHKAVHAEFAPAKRHRDSYADKPIIYPPSFRASDQPVRGKRNFGAGGPDFRVPHLEPNMTESYYGPGRMPDWQKMQREGWHGVDYMYHGRMDFEEFFQRYCETLRGVDESIGSVMAYLEAAGLDESTMVIYMGDNGFQFGDHGLIDKRTAYEASARVPLLLAAKDRIPAGITFDGLVGNIDVASTVLEATGSPPLPNADGQSIWKPLLQNDPGQLERKELLYEYYWERNYPHTPTLHAIIGGRWKYIRCHGLWDRDELYDLKNDPDEMHNLIEQPEHAERISAMNRRLWKLLMESDGSEMPLLEDRGPRFPWRHPGHSRQAPFPKEYFRTSESGD
ncbi:MAG: sulfatase/phosphatase domain-containing protein, partial [Planctomycetota bacterium]